MTEADTGNAWYWRFDRRPLDAEALRDALLDLGGSLDRSRPGPHPFPPAESWNFTAHHQFKAVYPSDHRSVYLMVQRLHPHPYLALFNGPDASMSTAVRDGRSSRSRPSSCSTARSCTSRPAGSPRSLIEQESDPAGAAPARLPAGLRAAADGRGPIDRSRSSRGIEQALAEEGVPADRREAESWSSLARTLLASNEFIYVND